MRDNTTKMSANAQSCLDLWSHKGLQGFKLISSKRFTARLCRLRMIDGNELFHATMKLRSSECVHMPRSHTYLGGFNIFAGRNSWHRVHITFKYYDFSFHTSYSLTFTNYRSYFSPLHETDEPSDALWWIIDCGRFCCTKIVSSRPHL